MKAKELTYKLHKLVFLIDKIADKTLQEKVQLTFSQFKVLLAIDHKTVCQREIAQYWDLTEAAVSRQTELMMEKGIISRVENKENRRAYRLSLTKKGETMLEKAESLIDSIYTELYSVIDQKEQTELLTSLEKLLKTVCKDSHEETCL